MVTLEDVLEVVGEVEPTGIDGDGSVIYWDNVHLFIDKKRNPQWWIEEYSINTINMIKIKHTISWEEPVLGKKLNQTNFFNKEHLKHYLETVKLKQLFDNL